MAPWLTPALLGLFLLSLGYRVPLFLIEEINVDAAGDAEPPDEIVRHVRAHFVFVINGLLYIQKHRDLLLREAPAFAGLFCAEEKLLFVVTYIHIDIQAATEPTVLRLVGLDV